MPLVNRTFDQLIDFTRTSAATFVNSSGNIASTPQSRNLLTFTQEFDNAAWIKQNATVAANSTAAPDGTNTADTVTISAQFGNVRQALSPTISTGSVTISVWLRVASGTRNVHIRATTTSTVYQSEVTVTTTWTRFTATFAYDGVNPFDFFTIQDRAASGFVPIFIWGAQLEQASSATDYTRNFGGLFPPRFDYDPVTLAPKGLLIEEQRTNLLTYSDQFDNAAWTKSLCTVVANNTTAPDGTTSADKVTDTSSSGTELSQTATVSSGVTVAHSRYFKYVDCRWVRITIGDATNFVRGWFDIQNGVVGSTAVGGVGANAAISISNAGNGWYRCTLIGALTGLTSYPCLSMTADANSSTARVANASYFVYGAQLEAGSFATSYIPTVASQVTRTADVAAINAPNFAPWFNPDQGAIVFEGSIARRADLPVLTGYRTPGTASFLFVDNANVGSWNGSVVVTQAGGSITNGVTFKAAMTYSPTGRAVTSGGGTPASDSNTIGAAALLSLGMPGSGPGGGQVLNGHIRSIRYYPTRLTNAQLQALTA